MIRAEFLADDHPMVLEAFKALLEPDFEVVGMVTDGRALLDEFRRGTMSFCRRPYAAPQRTGCGRRLKAQRQAVKLIYLTMNPNRAGQRSPDSGRRDTCSRARPSRAQTAIDEELLGIPTSRLITSDVVGLFIDPRPRGHQLTGRQRVLTAG